jgi:hypothetical protein
VRKLLAGDFDHMTGVSIRLLWTGAQPLQGDPGQGLLFEAKGETWLFREVGGDPPVVGGRDVEGGGKGE